MTSRTRRAATRPHIDTDEFCRTGGTLSGVQPVGALERLASLLFDDQGSLAWSLHGRRERRPDGGLEPFLDLAVDGEVGMACTRCTERVTVPLGVRRAFKLVSDEVLAEREDPESERYDVIVGGRDFDVLELVEDETILALPIAPRHEQCPAGAGAALATAADAQPASGEARSNPFEALAALRKRDGRSG